MNHLNLIMKIFPDVCQNILCSNHGTCEPDDANRPTCVCNGQWRGDWCEVKSVQL